MAAGHKFDCFITDVAAGVHAGALNADTDTLSVYLANEEPQATDRVKADVAEIGTGYGYTGPIDVENTAVPVGPTIEVRGLDKAVVTASGGPIGPFRYAVLYNSTPAGGPLIQWWDYGEAVILQDGDAFTIDFGATLFILGG